MTTILLVDDESQIRNIIAHQLDLTGTYRVTAQASDGLEALKIIRKSAPDIVITDIAMPFYDGLYLAKTIQDEFPAVKVVIMSGYNNFEYAQKAMKYGVRDYLLKPFMPKDLIAVLDRLRKEIEISPYAPTDGKSRRRNFLLTLIRNDNLDTRQTLNMLSLLGIDLDENNFAISIINCFTCGAQNNTLRPLIWERIGALMTEKTGTDIKCISFQDSTNRLTIIYSFSLSFPAFQKKISLIMQSIHDEVEQEFQTFAYFATSAYASSFHSLKRAYEEAEELWMLKFDQTNIVDFYAKASPHTEENKEVLDRITSLGDQIMLSLSLKKGNAEETITSLFSEISHYGKIDFPQANTLVVNFMSALSRTIGNEENAKYFSQFFSSSFNKKEPYANIWQTFTLARKAIACYLSQAAKDNIPQAQIIVTHIKGQIAKNIGNPSLTVDDTIKNLNFSSSYARYIFSQEEGKSIKEYITFVRMEKAKELLGDALLPIKEIAERVGFQNQRYFASTFKSYAGLSPTEYRESINPSGK